MGWLWTHLDGLNPQQQNDGKEISLSSINVSRLEVRPKVLEVIDVAIKMEKRSEFPFLPIKIFLTKWYFMDVGSQMMCLNVCFENHNRHY